MTNAHVLLFRYHRESIFYISSLKTKIGLQLAASTLLQAILNKDD